MKDSELQIDRSCHVLYSKPCKKEILAKITLHYPEVEREAVWEQVQLRYAELLSKWRTDLGGKKNFHNGVGGTYDCIAIMCFYDVCRDVVTFREMEEIEKNLILPAFRKLKFVDCNKPFWRKLMYKAFVRAKSGCDKWHDYEMSVAPYETGKPIYYEFTSCPAAEFAKRFGFTDIMPALCNVDYASMEPLHARLVRTTTCVDGCRCDLPSAAIKTRMQRNILNTGMKTDTGGISNAFTGDSGRSWVGSSAGSDLRCGHP